MDCKVVPKMFLKPHDPRFRKGPTMHAQEKTEDTVRLRKETGYAHTITAAELPESDKVSNGTKKHLCNEIPIQ